MRIKKSVINSFVNIVSYILVLIPTFILRRMFLIYLGPKWLGLNSLFSNIIGFLSIMELGIGSAIIFSLYKPFANNDRVKVKGYIDLYSKVYKIVGNLILIIGILLTPFLKIFINNEVDIFTSNICFILTLLNTYITYLFSYKTCILNVAQEEFRISLSSSISKIIISIIQMIFMVIIPNFIIYLIIQLVINIVYYLILNKYIDNRYTWLKSVEGNLEREEKINFTKNIKALFLHKIGNFVVYSTDNLMITYFIDLATTSKYNSYSMVINSAKIIIDKGLSGITASIGNLLVSEDCDKSYEVHKRIFFITFWVVSFVSIGMYNVLDQFISIWMGKEQLIDKFTLFVIIFNFYFAAMRGSVEKFQEGSGTYTYDKYVPLIESIINIFSSIILVKLIGLPGIFIGTLISNLLVVFWTKPLIVYKYVFNVSVLEYFKMYIKYSIISIIPLYTSNIVGGLLCYNNTSIISLMNNVIINTFIVNITYFIIFRNSKEYLYFKKLIMSKIKKIVYIENI